MTIELLEGSRHYKKEVDLYELFSEAEDAPGKIIKFLRLLVENKIVLDVGIGNGKIARILAPITKKYIGIDVSKEQIEKAKKNTLGMKNVKLINSSAEEIPLESESVDIVFGTWSFSTVNGDDRRNKILNESLRVLKKGKSVYIIENSPGGEFDNMINHRKEYIKRMKARYRWFDKHNIKEIKIIETYFEFNSLVDAREIMGGIWGEEIKKLIEDKKIQHKVGVYEKTKKESSPKKNLINFFVC